jgi:hypothetical protein
MAYIVCWASGFIRHLYGETVSWSLAIASTAQLAIGRGSTPLGDTFFAPWRLLPFGGDFPFCVFLGGIFSCC